MNVSNPRSENTFSSLICIYLVRRLKFSSDIQVTKYAEGEKGGLETPKLLLYVRIIPNSFSNRSRTDLCLQQRSNFDNSFTFTDLSNPLFRNDRRATLSFTLSEDLQILINLNFAKSKKASRQFRFLQCCTICGGRSPSALVLISKLMFLFKIEWKDDYFQKK